MEAVVTVEGTEEAAVGSVEAAEDGPAPVAEEDAVVPGDGPGVAAGQPGPLTRGLIKDRLGQTGPPTLGQTRGRDNSTGLITMVAVTKQVITRIIRTFSPF